MKTASAKSIIMSLLALAFPWVILSIDDNPGGALVALILQATVIGWLPASVWAWRIVHQKPKKKPQARKKELE